MNYIYQFFTHILRFGNVNRAFLAGYRQAACVILLGFLFFAGMQNQAMAQNTVLVWDNTTPGTTELFYSQEPEEMVVLGDEGYLFLRFWVREEFTNDRDLIQPRIQVALPTGVVFFGTTVATTLVGEPDLTPISFFNTATIPANTSLFTFSSSETVRMGMDTVTMKIRVKVNCNADITADNKVTYNVTHLGGFTMIQQERTFKMNLLRPTFRLSPNPIDMPKGWLIDFDNILDTAWVSIDLDVQNGYMQSGVIQFQYNGSIVYMDSFMLDGKLLPIINTNIATTNPTLFGVFHNPRATTGLPTWAATQRTFIRLRADSEYMPEYLNETPKNLKFRVSANRGCLWTIQTAIHNNLEQFDHSRTFAQWNIASCNNWSDNSIELQNPGDPRAAQYETYTAAGALATSNPVILRTTSLFNFDDPYDLTPIPDPFANLTSPNAPLTPANMWNFFCWDGVTPNYHALIFKNINSAEAIEFQFATQLWHGTNLSPCEFIDQEQVYYRITVPSKLTGQDSLVVPVTRILSTDRDMRNQVCIAATNNYNSATLAIQQEYNSILWNKSRQITFRLPNIDMSNPIPADAKIEFQFVVYGNPAWINDGYRSRSNYSNVNASQNNNAFRWFSVFSRTKCVTDRTTGDTYGTILYKPRFYAQQLNPLIACYSEESFYYSPGETTTGTANTLSVNDPAGLMATGQRYAQYYIKIPEWLSLDTLSNPGALGGIASAFNVRSTYDEPGTPSGRPEPGSGVFHGSSGGYKIYSVKYFGTTTGVMDVRLIPDKCETEIATRDTLQMWIDWIGGSPNEPEDCRPIFRKTSKVWSTVEWNCIPPALRIDSLGVFRVTRGLKDSNNDHDPDDGTLALDNQIDHWRFLERDTGYFWVKGVVGGAPTASNEYNKLVLVLKYINAGPLGATHQYMWAKESSTPQTTYGSTIPFGATIDIMKNGVWETYPVEIQNFTQNVLDSLVLIFHGDTYSCWPRGGDSCYIKVPFYAKQGVNSNNIRGSYNAISYGIKAATPTRWTNKYLPYGAYRFIIRTFDLMNRSSISTAYSRTHPTSCNQQNYPELYTKVFGNTGFNETCEWPYEVRYRQKLQTIELRIPAGFYRPTNTIQVQLNKFNVGNTEYLVHANTALNVIPDKAIEDFATGDSIFTINMTRYIDYEYDGSQRPERYILNPNTTAATPPVGSGALVNPVSPEKRFPLGDDVQGARCMMDLIATPASMGSEITGRMDYINYYGEPKSLAIQTEIATYTGRILYMDVTPEIMVFSQKVSSRVNIQNPHGTYINDSCWLFVKGNIYDTYLVNLDNPTDTIWGQGTDHCWLKLGTVGPRFSQNYNLIYSLKSKTDCTNDTITIYSVFDAIPSGFSPNIEAPIENVPLCNRGPKKHTILDLLTAKIKIAGTIATTIPNPAKEGYLHHNKGYWVDYTINGKVSQGALNDPCVTVFIPAAQKYVDTIPGIWDASFEYPIGSGFRPMPEKILTEIKAYLGSEDNLDEIREFTFCAKDLLEEEYDFMLPGWGYTPFGYTDRDRNFNVRVPLIPTCNTDLTGIRFRGIFNGKTFCGEECEDNGTQFITPSIFSDITPQYSFSVEIAHVNPSRVLTPDQTIDTIIVTFKKDLTDPPIEIKADDYVLLRLSDNMVIDSETDYIYSPQFGNIHFVLDDEVDGLRLYKLDLPYEALNNLIYIKEDEEDEIPTLDTIPFTYYIPILYIPSNDFDCTSPRKELECMVTSDANFSEEGDEEQCEPTRFNLGSASMFMLTLNYDTEQFVACLNQPTPITIGCSFISPMWFKDKDGQTGQFWPREGIQYSDDDPNTFVYTPTVQKDTTFYVNIIYFWKGGADEDSYGMAPVHVRMHPQVIADFSIPPTCSEEEVTFANSSTVGGDDCVLGGNTKSYEWFLNNASIPFSTVKEPSLVLNSNDRVTLRVTSENDCVHQVEQTATLKALPTPRVTGKQDVCHLETTTYSTEPGMLDYVWYVTNGTYTQINANTIDVTWNLGFGATLGYVKVLYTNPATDCRAKVNLGDSLAVSIRVPPAQPVIQGHTTSCLNSVATYTYDAPGGTGFTKIWNLVGTGGVVVAGGGEGDSYISIRWTVINSSNEITLYVINTAGCESLVGSTTITVNREIFPNFIADTVCMNTPTPIKDKSFIGLEESTESNTYKWYWYLNEAVIPFDSVQNTQRVLKNNDYIRLSLVSAGPEFCVRDTSIRIAVYDLPVAVISGGSSNECLYECVTYYTQPGMTDYVWTVSNGTHEDFGTSAEDSIKVCWNGTHTTPGLVTVNFTDENGCKAALNAEKIVYLTEPPPAPDFTGSLISCANSEETYTYINAAFITKYEWTVVGGTVVAGGSAANGGAGADYVRVRWNGEPGTKSVSLFITDWRGCKPEEPTEKIVTVTGEVIASFTHEPVCYDKFTTLVDESTLIGNPSDNIATWHWYRNNGTTLFHSPNNAPPDTKFNVNESVRLRVTSENGCVRDTTVQLTVHALPIPTISNHTDSCAKQCVEYSTQGGMNNYVWTVTNGTFKDEINNVQNVTICWNNVSAATPGTISVNFEDLNGCVAASNTERRVTVQPLPATPVILGNPNVCYNSEITYTYEPQTGFTIEDYYWIVNGGNVVSGSGLSNNSVTVNWHTKGTYLITLVVFDNNGCTSDDIGELFVNVEGELVPDFSFTTVCIGDSTTFTNLSTIDGLDSDNSNTKKWYWYQNLSTTPFDSVQHPKFKLNWGDSVRLRVISNFNCVADITKKIIHDTLPVPVIAGSIDECFKQCTTYETLAGMGNYKWSVTNGNIVGSDNTASVEVCWNEDSLNRNGYVKVIYTDGNGCRALGKDSINVNVRVLPVMPVITGTGNPCINAQETYKFTPQAGFTIDSYVWTVTGGTPTAGGNGFDSIRVNWTADGTQTITLTIIDEHGCAPDNIGTLSINVQPRVRANFIADTVCFGLPNHFTDKSFIGTVPATTTNTAKWEWYLEDAVSPFTTTTNHATIVDKTLDSAGVHNIKLVVTTLAGCVGDTTIKVKVRDLPEPAISGKEEVCHNEYTVYRTEAGMTNYVWTVTNGTIQETNPTDSITVRWDKLFAPTKGGVTVTYEDPFGCSSGTASDHIEVTINPLPATPVITGLTTPCFNTEWRYEFSPLSQPDFTFTKYQWSANVGDITSYGGIADTLAYIEWAESGTQQITLIITDNNGCSPGISGTLNITVQPELLPNFRADTVCLGTATPFTDLSYLEEVPSSTANTDKWYWYLDGSTTPFDSTKTASIIVPAPAGDHSAKLRIVTPYGCAAEITKSFYVRLLPVPTITGATDICYKQCDIYRTEKGMTNYVWSVTNGTILGGINNRDSVTICWNDNFDIQGNVKVLYTDVHGCRSVENAGLNVTIYELPDVPTFTGNTTPCFEEVVTYHVVSQTGFTFDEFVWAISGSGYELISGGNDVNGGKGCDSIRVKWLTSGTRTITLDLKTDLGCSPETAGSLTITVQSELFPNFRVDTVCFGTATPFTDLSYLEEIPSSTANTDKWYWYLDGSSTPFDSTKTASIIVPAPAGDHSAKLRIVTPYGCAAETTQSFYVRSLPVPTITGILDPCNMACATYKTQEGMTNYQWSVHHGFMDPESFSDTLHVCWAQSYIDTIGYVKVDYTDANGCRSAGNDSLRVRIFQLDPTFNIIGDTVPCFGTEKLYSPPLWALIKFINNDKWFWNLSGGGTIVGGGPPNENAPNGQNIIIIKWTEPGIHELSIMVVDENGCPRLDGDGILRINVQPRINANFVADTVCFGNEISFTDLTKFGAATPLVSDVASWLWKAGDSTLSTLQNFSFDFPVGEHDVTLTVTGKNNCVGDTTIAVLVNALPTPTITTDNTVFCFKDTIGYKTQSGMKTYVWDVPNGTIISGAGTDSITVCWNVDPSLSDSIMLTVTDYNDCSASAKLTGLVIHPKPVTPQMNGLLAPCIYTATTYRYIPQPGIEIANYLWTFDGGIGAIVIGGGGLLQDSIRIDWLQPGEYVLYLDVITVHGCTPDTIGEFKIKQPPITPDFIADPVCIGDTTYFTDMTTIGYLSATEANTQKWYWYADGSTVPFDSVQNPKFKFSLGSHNIRLKIISDIGCEEETTKSILVRALPVPTVTGSDSLCFKDEVTYITENANIATYVWSVPNATFISGEDTDELTVKWDKTPAANDTVKVTVTDIYGCTDSTYLAGIRIYALPEVPEISGNITPCIDVPETYTFVSQSGFDIIDYTWTVEGGEITGGGNGYNFITVLWDEYGTDKLTLSVTSEFGCISPILGELDIEIKGAYTTITGPTELCLDFIPMSYATQTGMSNYSWSITGGTFPSGNISNPVTVIWNTDGIGTLTVTYTDVAGCHSYQIESFEAEIIVCKVIDCEKSFDRIVEEDGVKVGFYTLLDNSWDLQVKLGFTFDSIQYYINGELYSHGPTATLAGAQFPVRVTSTVRGIAYFNDIPDTCEFTVYVIMACPNSVDDIETNTYDVTSLVGLCWTSNIASTLYSDATPIVFANPYYSYIYTNIVENKEIFGLLYTWYSAVGAPEGSSKGRADGFVQGICPEGWHVPSIAEWNLLQIYDTDMLKSENHWIVPGTNETEFNSLPAGMFNGTAGRYVDLYGATGYWSADEGASQTTAFYFGLTYYCSVIQTLELPKIDAVSVRCVMDY